MFLSGLESGLEFDLIYPESSEFLTSFMFAYFGLEYNHLLNMLIFVPLFTYS
jgi:hypothetical protein